MAPLCAHLLRADATQGSFREHLVSPCYVVEEPASQAGLYPTENGKGGVLLAATAVGLLVAFLPSADLWSKQMQGFMVNKISRHLFSPLFLTPMNSVGK